MASEEVGAEDQVAEGRPVPVSLSEGGGEGLQVYCV